MTLNTNQNLIVSRMIRAAQLDVNFYEEVEADTSLNTEALTVVILVSAAGGIGSFLSSLFGGSLLGGLGALVFGVIMGIAGYYIWAYLTFFIGTNLFKGTADPGEMLRTLGYASAPQALAIFSFIPIIGGLLGLVGGIWALVAGVIAVRQAMDFDTTNAIITVVIGWVVVAVITLVVGLVLGIGAAGAGLLMGAF